jgi:putative membrane protein
MAGTLGPCFIGADHFRRKGGTVCLRNGFLFAGGKTTPRLAQRFSGLCAQEISMKSAIILVASLFVAGATAAQAQSSSLSSADRSFAKNAAQAGIAEVDAGKLAVNKTSNASVKEFAQRMVTDHGKANDQLMQIGQQEGLQLPSTPSSSDQKKAAALSKESGTQFDKDYVKNQLAAHKQAVALFTKESKNGKDPALKSFATQTLPTLQEHLSMVTTLSQNSAASNGK